MLNRYIVFLNRIIAGVKYCACDEKKSIYQHRLIFSLPRLQGVIIDSDKAGDKLVQAA